MAGSLNTTLILASSFTFTLLLHCVSGNILLTNHWGIALVIVVKMPLMLLHRSSSSNPTILSNSSSKESSLNSLNTNHNTSSSHSICNSLNTVEPMVVAAWA